MGAVASAMACASPTPADASSAVVEVTEVDRAVLELKRTKSALESRARRAREDIARDVAAARENVSSFPIVAKRHLRAKRAREAMVERLHDYELVVERALLELDAALMTSETARALRSGRDALVTVTRACEDVDELMRDLEGWEDGSPRAAKTSRCETKKSRTSTPRSRARRRSAPSRGTTRTRTSSRFRACPRPRSRRRARRLRRRRKSRRDGRRLSQVPDRVVLARGRLARDGSSDARDVGSAERERGETRVDVEDARASNESRAPRGGADVDAKGISGRSDAEQRLADERGDGDGEDADASSTSDASVSSSIDAAFASLARRKRGLTLFERELAKDEDDVDVLAAARSSPCTRIPTSKSTTCARPSIISRKSSWNVWTRTSRRGIRCER